MKTLIMGCGNIGSIAAEDLASSASSVEVTVADKNETKAKEVAEKIDRKNVSWMQLDATQHDKLISALKDFDLVMGFLPGNLGYCLAEACIDARKDLVDVSYMSENPLTLNAKATSARVTVVPDCGLAPGISNVLVGHAAAELDLVETVHIRVGGLPEKPIPPLGYVITWSPESLIDEYMRKATIVRKGKRVKVEALSGLEKMKRPSIGKLEAFYTDGLRTLLDTVENVDEMWEKTLRYVGHAEKIKLLQTLGFFDEKPIDVEGVSLLPRKVTAKLLEQRLRKPEIEDIVILEVEIFGVKNGKKVGYAYHMLDRYDKKRRVTAMARTTAYPMSIVAQLMLKGAVKEKGVIPPEKIGMNNELFQAFLVELEKRRIRIVEKKVC